MRAIPQLVSAPSNTIPIAKAHALGYTCITPELVVHAHNIHDTCTGGTHVLYNTCTGGPIPGVLFTAQYTCCTNMHYTCTGGTHASYTTCNGDLVLGVLFTIYANKHYICIGLHLQYIMHVLGVSSGGTFYCTCKLTD